ncbi:MAG: hypothetical protein GXY38_05395 [Planctomycetes bacterium]|nr:hypothetical protein [Planctomycetota bacterium]
MNWKLPNQLTVGRILLSAVFFVLLGLFEQGGQWSSALLNAAFVLYIIAGITDILDGWIARRFNWTSAFGRIADPFVDKVLVVGAFVMLAGSNFAMPADLQYERTIGVPAWLTGSMASSVQAWMVVVVLAREFIVSAVRGYSESQGVKFPATPAGKAKMFVQSFAICAILYQMANLPQTPWAAYLKVGSVWAAVLITLLSGLAYVGKAREVLARQEKSA